MYRKIMILMATSVILVPSIHAFSLRLNVPVSESYEVDDCSDCSPTSSGYSIEQFFRKYSGSALDMPLIHIILVFQVRQNGPIMLI